MNSIMENALKACGLTKDDMVKALVVQKALSASGVSPQVCYQTHMFLSKSSKLGPTLIKLGSTLTTSYAYLFCAEQVMAQAVLFQKAFISLTNNRIVRRGTSPQGYLGAGPRVGTDKVGKTPGMRESIRAQRGRWRSALFYRVFV